MRYGECVPRPVTVLGVVACGRSAQDKKQVWDRRSDLRKAEATSHPARVLVRSIWRRRSPPAATSAMGWGCCIKPRNYVEQSTVGQVGEIHPALMTVLPQILPIPTEF
jgi:hypothetical protein